MTEKVLVIGGTGFIGTHVCNRLDEKGFEVTAGSPNAEDTTKLNSDVTVELVDILYHGSLNFEDFDTVVNLVGLSPLFEPSGVTYEEIHVEGVQNIVDEALRADVDQLVHMSAYGADPDAKTEYLRTKGEGEKLVTDSDLRTCVFRPSLVLGHGGELDNLLRSLRHLPVAVLPANPKFQPIAVDDVADIFAEAVERNSTGVYDIGGEEAMTLKEIVKRKYPGKTVFIAPEASTKYGLKIAEYLPVRLGMDQYHSLKMDNSLENNQAEKFLDDFRPFSV